MTAERIEFEVAGEAVAKQRPRMGRGRRLFTPSRTVTAEARVGYAAQMAMGDKTPFEGAIALTIEIAVAVPGSWSRRRREAALAGHVRPTSRPDVDNVAKLICDSLNHIAFVDDRQITELVVQKHYAPAGSMRIVIEPLAVVPVQPPEESSR